MVALFAGVGFFQAISDAKAAVAWDDLAYSLARSQITLRLPGTDDPKRRWQQRTPAMAGQLTDQVWSVQELLATFPVPRTKNS